MSKSIQEFLGTDAIQELRAETQSRAAQKERETLSGPKQSPSPGWLETLDALTRSRPVAALRGLGRGATLGLTDPVAALTLKTTRALTGGEPTTFQDALSEIKQINSELAKRTEYKAGEIAGNIGTAFVGTPVTLGATAFKTAKTMPIIGRGAIAGGLTGIGETENLSQLPENVVLSALAGGALSSVAGLANVGRGMMTKRYQQEMMEKKEMIMDKFMARFPEMTNEQYEKLNSQVLAFLNKEYLQLGAVAGRTAQKIGETIIGAVGPGTLGAGLGAGTAAIAGQDPYLGALIGGAGVAAAAKASAIDDIWRGIRDISIRPVVRSDVIAPTIMEVGARAVQPSISQQYIKSTEEKRVENATKEFYRKYGTQQ
jgi:hypothetical protein